jgi:hypothetical protein
MIRYGLNIENCNLICVKAKEKKDGVYTFRGVTYRVVSGHVTHYAYDRKILENFGNFNCVVGQYEYTDEMTKRLKKL